MTVTQKVIRIGTTAMAVVLLAAVPSTLFAAPSASQALQDAGIQIADLNVQQIEAITIVRGNVTSAAERDRIAPVLALAGYQRVANMVQVVGSPNDLAIARAAERELSRKGVLEGSNLRVSCKNGVVVLGGAVRSANQRQLALDTIHHLSGVRAVRADL